MKCLKRLFFVMLFSQWSIIHAETLYLGVYTSDKASSMYKKFYPIIDYLNRDLSRRLNKTISVKLKIYKTYEQAQNAIVKGDIDVARFGPASYVLVKKRNPGIRLLVMENKKGANHFYGVVITKSNNQIRKLSDLQGKSFAFGNKRSTIGRYLAQYELLKAGINHSKLSSYKFLGRHDKVLKSVVAGKYIAGSVKESTYKKLDKKGQLKVIHKFSVATKPWLVKSTMKDDIYNSLRDSLLQLNIKAILKSHKVKGFLSTSDKDYDFIRQGMLAAENF